jgi:glycosyltransferase involved in cell wall biosynthesis
MAVRCHTPAWVLERYTGPTAPYSAALLGKAEKRVIRRADVLTAPSNDMARVISTDCQIPLERVHPIANALDTDEFTPAPAPHQSKQVTILAVGRLDPFKGIDVLIEAIPQVCQQVPHVRFVVVGSPRNHPDGGNYHDYMRKVLAPQIAAGQVEMRGFVADSGLPGVYHESNISVVNSLIYESFSFTVAQSMACGLPVVASRIGGIPQTVGEGKYGVLVKPGSVPELVEALVGLVRDPERRLVLGQIAREHAAAHFSPEVVAKRILDVYQQAIN